MTIQEFLMQYREYVAGSVDRVGVKIRKSLPKELVIENRSEFYSVCQEIFGDDNPIARHYYRVIWDKYVLNKSLND